MDVFMVTHVHDAESSENEKTIGIYSSMERAEEAVLRASCLEGFRDSVDGFDISKVIVDKDYWEEGYITILHD